MEMLIPAEQYFRDFASGIESCEVMRTGALLDGLHNEDENGKHIAFLYGCDIKAGDIISSDNKRYVISYVEVDKYNGNRELVKAYH